MSADPGSLRDAYGTDGDRRVGFVVAATADGVQIVRDLGGAVVTLDPEAACDLALALVGAAADVSALR